MPAYNLQASIPETPSSTDTEGYAGVSSTGALALQGREGFRARKERGKARVRHVICGFTQLRLCVYVCISMEFGMRNVAGWPDGGLDLLN